MMKNKLVNKIKHLFIGLILIFLLSCKGEAKEVHQDGDFKIEFLFEQDGCKIYRFKDSGRYIYWTNCSGNIQSNYHQQAGRSGYTVRMESFTSVN
jgi:hypothetical protein